MRGPLFSRGLTPAALVLLSAGLLPQHANGHGFAGDRFFPATIVVDDPAVADELSLPTVANFKNGDNSYETDISAELVEAYHRAFRRLDFSETWTHLSRAATAFKILKHRPSIS